MLERGKGREKERGRNNDGLPLMRTNQAYALTGNRTADLSVGVQSTDPHEPGCNIFINLAYLKKNFE